MHWDLDEMRLCEGSRVVSALALLLLCDFLVV